VPHCEHCFVKFVKGAYKFIQYTHTVHRLGVGEAVVREQVALSILLQFLCNISICLSCTAQLLVLSYHRLLTVVLA
jgi:hypothetical protein